MKKRILTRNLINNLTLYKTTGNATIFKMKNGDILKIFSPFYLTMAKIGGINLERKIEDSEKVKLSDEIKKPVMSFYDEKNTFIGYSCNPATGISYNEREDTLSLSQREDLYMYGDIFTKLEKIVKESDAVFPDLCTCDNIFIDENNNIQLIDYDGLQVGNQKVMQISTTLGDDRMYYNSKYMKNDLFTKNLDKKSLILLYFLSAFNTNLNMVGKKIPETGEIITLDMFFEFLGIEDYDFMNKVSKIFNDKVENEYLGESLYDIAESYNMIAIPAPMRKGYYVKRLTRK